MTLTVTFKLGTDPDKAQQLVQNRVAQALPRLPEEVRRLGVTTIKSSPDLTMVVHLLSPNDRYDMTLPAQLRACCNVKDGWRASPASATVHAVRRRRLRDARLARSAEGRRSAASPPSDVVARDPRAERAGRRRRRRRAAGAARRRLPALDQRAGPPAAPRRSSATSSCKTGADGAVTRLRDVARIELGAADYALRSLLDNKPAVGDRRSSRRPGSNAIADLRRRARDDGASSRQTFPQGVDYEIVYDPTHFVRASIEAVVHTLLEADRAGRAGRDPVPADLARLDHPAARGAGVDRSARSRCCSLLGFSINALTLFGLVLAIGIVVDDAIVVVENVERNIEAGLSPREATYQAMREVSGPIIAIALVLCAVFVPLAFISGLTGQFYQQFALTIAISTVISAFNSLTLSPALARAAAAGRTTRRKDALTRVMDRVARLVLPRLQPRCSGAAPTRYSGGVDGVICAQGASRWSSTSVLVGAHRSACSSAVPGGFVPAQDKQYLIGFAQLPDGATLDRTEDVIRRMSEIALKQPGRRARGRVPGPVDQRLHQQLERRHRLRRR